MLFTILLFSAQGGLQQQLLINGTTQSQRSVRVCARFLLNVSKNLVTYFSEAQLAQTVYSHTTSYLAKKHLVVTFLNLPEELSFNSSFDEPQQRFG